MTDTERTLQEKARGVASGKYLAGRSETNELLRDLAARLDALEAERDELAVTLGGMKDLQAETVERCAAWAADNIKPRWQGDAFASEMRRALSPKEDDGDG